MTKTEIIVKVKELNLPQDSYVVYGSCPLAAAGIREVKDIDLVVSPEVLANLKKAGWREVEKAPNDKPITHDVFEAHDKRGFSSYSPTLEHLQRTATIINGVPFASLEEVRKWKAASGRPKDLADIELINEYLRNSVEKSD